MRRSTDRLTSRRRFLGAAVSLGVGAGVLAARRFPVGVLHKERSVNKAELTAALAMRTKMSKADATRTVEALFDDKGIIAGELKKGAKVQITGFGNFEARKRAARQGRNPKTGETITIKATIAPAFRAGKQLKQAVNRK